MEAFEKIILIRFFITDYFQILDLDINEFGAFTVSSIKQNLIDKYYDPYGDIRSIEGVLLEFSKTNNDEDFVKLFYDLMRYLVRNPKLAATKDQQQLEQCKSILTKYIAPSFVVFKELYLKNLNMSALMTILIKRMNKFFTTVLMKRSQQREILLKVY